jgi:putative acetyltransferase
MAVQHLIREYAPDDLADILSAWESASALAHTFLTKQFVDQERINIPELYLPNVETWVVEDSGRVIGFIALIGNKIGAIFVDPEFHGSGAGRALMDKARELRGDLEVEVFKENAIGRKFYARYGFELLAETIHEATGNALLRLKFSPS